ncbi:hypothetical protein [Candidatus Darwinibacter acetoxidans]
MKKVFFTSNDVIQGRDCADLGEYGTFSAYYILIDPEHPETVRAVGTLETMPAHLKEPVTIPAATLDLDLDLEPFDVAKTLTAADLFNAPWRGWTCDDIPEGWEY